MQTFKKNQIIITALVILIAIAGYLNFADTGVDGTREAINQQEKKQVMMGNNTNCTCTQW